MGFQPPGACMRDMHVHRKNCQCNNPFHLVSTRRSQGRVLTRHTGYHSHTAILSRGRLSVLRHNQQPKQCRHHSNCSPRRTSSTRSHRRTTKVVASIQYGYRYLGTIRKPIREYSPSTVGTVAQIVPYVRGTARLWAVQRTVAM